MDTPQNLTIIEENKQLIRENKRLQRELERQRAINQRNQISAAAKANLSQIVSDEKSRLEQYMNLVLGNSPDSILLFDSTGRTVYASDSYLKRSHTPAVSLIRDQTLPALLAPLVSAAFLDELTALTQHAMAEKQRIEVEQDIDFAQDGNLRHYVIQLTPMLDESGEVAGAMAFFHDTTDITRARDEAERARLLAEQSTRAKSDFLSRMSHEMRTPLNAIIGMSNIGQRTDDMERVQYALTKVSEASKHLLGVINDILDISKIEAEKFELYYDEFNFESMLQRVVNVNRFRLEEKAQSLTLSIDPAIPAAFIGDEQRLAQVITNLLSNAVKFTGEEGAIALEAALGPVEGDRCTLRIAVIDSGIGISQEQQARLFTNFEQADGSISRKYGGTGLGLAISKRIVEMMGGRIWVDSQVGKGAAFFVEVPLTRAKDAPKGTPGPTGQAAAPQENLQDAFAGFRILLVEDVEINREIVMSLLEPTALAFDCAENGQEAVALFSQYPDRYSLIFMDIQMPEMDGYEATRRIRALEDERGEGKHVPIIAMTANAFREDVEKSLAAGMDGHVAKPMDLEEVLRQLCKYLHPGESVS